MSSWADLKCWIFGHVYEAGGFIGTGVRCSRCQRERRIRGVSMGDVPARLREMLEATSRRLKEGGGKA